MNSRTCLPRPLYFPTTSPTNAPLAISKLKSLNYGKDGWLFLSQIAFPKASFSDPTFVRSISSPVSWCSLSVPRRCGHSLCPVFPALFCDSRVSLPREGLMMAFHSLLPTPLSANILAQTSSVSEFPRQMPSLASDTLLPHCATGSSRSGLSVMPCT